LGFKVIRLVTLLTPLIRRTAVSARSRRGPWRHVDAVEYATLEWVDWLNHRRLLETIGNVPPAELELAYYRQQNELALAA
jgi:transposase InsO family protein